MSQPPNMAVLSKILARMIPSDMSKLGKELLGLEIIDGPYKGVTYWYSKFNIDIEHSHDGMAAVTFTTQIHEAPVGFTVDEAFDEFCGEVLFAWLSYIQQNDMSPLLEAKPWGGVH